MSAVDCARQLLRSYGDREQRETAWSVGSGAGTNDGECRRRERGQTARSVGGAVACPHSACEWRAVALDHINYRIQLSFYLLNISIEVINPLVVMNDA